MSTDDFVVRDWDARDRQRQRDEYDRIAAEEDAAITGRMQASIIDRLEDDNRVLASNIRKLESEIKFLNCRHYALGAITRLLLEEIGNCPDDDRVHRLHIKSDDGKRPIDELYVKKFLEEAAEAGLGDAQNYLQYL